MVSDYFLLMYIAQQMREKGFEKYHFEPCLIVQNSEKQKIVAPGEFYYFVSTSCTEQFIIKSDIETFESSMLYPNLQLSHHREFTGEIHIQKDTNAQHFFEFVRVIPEEVKL